MRCLAVVEAEDVVVAEGGCEMMEDYGIDNNAHIVRTAIRDELEHLAEVERVLAAVDL